MSGVQDHSRGWSASNASCQRGAHKHHRSPGFRPGKPNSGSVSRDRCRAIWKNQETSQSSRRRPCGFQCPLRQVAAAVPIKTCHRLDRTEFKWLAEHVAIFTAPRAATTIPIVSQHRRTICVQPCIWDRSRLESQTSHRRDTREVIASANSSTTSRVQRPGFFGTHALPYDEWITCVRSPLFAEYTATPYR